MLNCMMTTCSKRNHRTNLFIKCRAREQLRASGAALNPKKGNKNWRKFVEKLSEWINYNNWSSYSRALKNAIALVHPTSIPRLFLRVPFHHHNLSDRIHFRILGSLSCLHLLNHHWTNGSLRDPPLLPAIHSAVGTGV